MVNVYTGLELRIWKGKVILKRAHLDLGGHFGQAKGHCKGITAKCEKVMHPFLAINNPIFLRALWPMAVD